MSEDACRLDVWLWRARFFKTRALAARFLEDGRVRLTRAGRPRRGWTRRAATVRPGDHLVFAIGGRLLAVTRRRRSASAADPPAEARELVSADGGSSVTSAAIDNGVAGLTHPRRAANARAQPTADESTMTYIVMDACIKCKFMDCVEVCPVDCFYEGENFLAINPDECIDCGVCEPECPVDAIKPDTEDEPDGKWLKINTDYSPRSGRTSPSRASRRPTREEFETRDRQVREIFLARSPARAPEPAGTALNRTACSSVGWN